MVHNGLSRNNIFSNVITIYIFPCLKLVHQGNEIYQWPRELHHIDTLIADKSIPFYEDFPNQLPLPFLGEQRCDKNSLKSETTSYYSSHKQITRRLNFINTTMIVISIVKPYIWAKKDFIEDYSSSNSYKM